MGGGASARWADLCCLHVAAGFGHHLATPLAVPQFGPVMGFECRGLELVGYKPDVFIVKSRSGQVFEADLSEGWVV